MRNPLEGPGEHRQGHLGAYKREENGHCTLSFYNSHFTGSPCWDLTSPACDKLEGSYNRNIKITNNLPYPTHRNLLPAICDIRPLKMILSRRLLTFIDKLKKSNKPVLSRTLRLVEKDARTVTGRNLRSILLLTDVSTISELQPSDLNRVSYYGEPEPWRVQSLTELFQIQRGEIEPPLGWNYEELDDIFYDLCCN